MKNISRCHGHKGAWHWWIIIKLAAYLWNTFGWLLVCSVAVVALIYRCSGWYRQIVCPDVRGPETNRCFWEEVTCSPSSPCSKSTVKLRSDYWDRQFPKQQNKFVFSIFIQTYRLSLSQPSAACSVTTVNQSVSIVFSLLLEPALLFTTSPFAS